MRNFELSRDEAEFLVDLLGPSDHYLAERLERDLRALFGMATKERQAEHEANQARLKTLATP